MSQHGEADGERPYSSVAKIDKRGRRKRASRWGQHDSSRGKDECHMSQHGEADGERPGSISLATNLESR